MQNTVDFPTGYVIELKKYIESEYRLNGTYSRGPLAQ